MKKLLLACASVVFGMGLSYADEVTFDFTTNDYGFGTSSTTYIPVGTKIEEGVVSLTLDKTEGNGFRMWTDGLRIYKGKCSFVVSAEEAVITSVTIQTKANAMMGFTTTTSSTKEIEWTGSADDVTAYFTPTSTGAITKVVVNYEVSSDLEAAELSFPEAEYSVKFPNGTFTAPALSKATDALASYSSSNEAVATVDAETGAVTIVKPGTTVITAKCEANEKYAAGSAKYTLTVFAAASSLQDLSELAALDAAGTFQIDCPLTVTYVNKRNVYVVDAQGDATLIYMANAEDAANYTVGDVLSTEWFVTYSPYFGLPEYVPAGELPSVTTQNATFDIPELSLGDVNDDYICKVINIKDLTFDNSLPAATNENVVITDGDASLTFRNTFGIPAFTPEAGKEYNVKGVLSVYENAQGRTLQFLPIEISVASGVASIEANEGVATYYDLNGRQVKGQLANGLYIRVLNGKASKVIVK